MTVLTYEVLEAVCVHPRSTLHSYVRAAKGDVNSNVQSEFYFVTVGERGIIRIWNSGSAVCVFEQKTSDVAFSYENNDFKRGFIAANVLPEVQELLCVIGDQQILFFSPRKESEGGLTLTLCKRFLGYNEEVLDMKFLDDDENFLAVATNAEQVWVYGLSSIACPYVLAGHTEIVICLEAGRCSNGSTLIVTGSKDNTVRVWDSVSRRCIGLGVGHTAAVGAIAFSKKKGDFFVSGSR